jgi:hypothetical protein
VEDFSSDLIFEYFSKSVEKIQVSLKSDENDEYFILRPIKIFIIYFSFLFRLRNIAKNVWKPSNLKFETSVDECWRKTVGENWSITNFDLAIKYQTFLKRL